jgi:mono/diheme cytochrome c family protein
MNPRHPEELRSPLCHPEELRSSRATRDPQRCAWFAALLLVIVTVAGCRAAPPPAKDAVQEAFRDDALSAQAARGHRVFLLRCATCHGPEGRGDGQNAYNLQPPPPDFQESLAKLPVGDRRKVIEGGTAALGRSPLCPPWGRTLAPDDVDALLAWLETAARPAVVGPGGEPPVRPGAAGGPP